MDDMDSQRITVGLLWGKYPGPVTTVNDLALTLDPARFRFVFLYLSDDGGQDNHWTRLGHPVVFLSSIPRLNAFRPSILIRLIRAIRREKIDILHCHAHKPTFYGALAGWLCPRLRILGHVHGLNRSSSFNRKLTNWFLFRRINRILPVAEAVKRDLLASNWTLAESKITVLENSIDFDRFAGERTLPDQVRRIMTLPEGSFVFGTVGRLEMTKGIRYLVDAFAIVHREFPKTQLILLGDGRFRGEYEKQVCDLGLSDCVRFLGFQPNIPQLLRGLDVFVMASVAEGMPRGILEAMAAGVPCVATRVGGIPEILGDGRFGILAEPADPHSLADAMRTLVRMKGQDRLQLAEAARSHTRDVYSHTVVREKLRAIYEAEFDPIRNRNVQSPSNEDL
ncbi:MAG: glycosyltransferase [Phycisphaerae bacterium]|nr:glycosyltransferase [Phycisphaerae bacterium]